ncbi:MAG: DUF3568 family protein [Candidatus Methylomirabilales bacterium]
MSRWSMRQAWAGLSLVAGVALLGGCVPLIVGGAAAVGAGVVYTQLNQAEKTFDADFARVERATRRALEALEMTPVSREERTKVGLNEESLELITYARNMKIVIHVERVLPAGVKVRVDAQRGTFNIQRDRTTATEIILKIDEQLRSA